MKRLSLFFRLLLNVAAPLVASSFGRGMVVGVIYSMSMTGCGRPYDQAYGQAQDGSSDRDLIFSSVAADGPSSSMGDGIGSSGDAGNTIQDAFADAAYSGALCPALFRYKPVAGASNLHVVGEWQGFNLPTAPPLSGPDGAGFFSALVNLPPGLWAYKIVYDQNGATNWILDPGQGRRKYLGGVENSAIKVADCQLPSFTVQSTQPSRPAAGKGTYQARLTFVDGIDSTGPDVAGYQASVDFQGAVTPLSPAQLQVDAQGNATISLGSLVDGKYRVVIRGKTRSGHVGELLRLVFWIEAEAFSWKDALIYMIVTDRYRDGDKTNNLLMPTPNVAPHGDFEGGDLQGVQQAIADGTFDKLGIRALWLTPFATNPQAAYPASDNAHQVTGYHGYWPTKAREVDPRIGGQAALAAMVNEAHKHGIRVLQDFVVHHVHKEHEYLAAHPTWFHQGCVCGTNNCDWTAHAQDCVFTDYLPNIDHTVPEADAAFVADAVWWLDTFDIDGLRVDAVKHVPEVATRNLAAEIRETFEPGGTRYFMMGETAMGWSNCPDPCNDANYGTIAKYIGPLGLDGQFDFVLYHGVSYNTFAYGDKGMIHADYWFKHGIAKYPADAIMTPYIGSHDTARFTTLADYRGQDAAHDRGIPGNQWSGTLATAPSDGEPYRRTRIGLSWLLALPGAPLLYYGDEYGQWGGVDPNNRSMSQPEANLNADQTATLAYVRKLGQARKNVLALRRGSYVSLGVTEDTLVFGRLIAPGQAAVVALTRASTAQMMTVDVGTTLGLAASTVLHDALGGPDVTVGAGGMLTVTIPPGVALVLAP